jgi:pilus assembly protein CpaF
MLPQRPPGSHPSLPGIRPPGSVASATSFEAVKRRVLARLEDRLNMSASRRMPQSLLRQSLRQQAEQITEQEGRGFTPADRDRLVDEVLGELFGYGPLEELFANPTVREIMVTGPAAVIARREAGQWLPTSVKFRDEAHVRAILDRIAAHAEAVGPVMTSVAVFDMKLPNGFRAITVIPPEGLDLPATAAFVRETILPPPATKETAAQGPANVSPRAPGSGLTTTPPPRTTPTDSPAHAAPERDPIARHRNRVLERLLLKFASLKVYDIQRLDVNELRKIISAYVTEYTEAEKIYLSDTDQGRITLEILTSLRR